MWTRNHFVPGKQPQNPLAHGGGGGMVEPMPTPLLNTAGFQRALVEWFQAHGAGYPWRATRDPYAVLVSEMMLQQTQIATVLGKGYYLRWMERFPTVQSLAEAEESEVLRLWEGLGYYSRARNLHRVSRKIVADHGGRFPQDVAALRQLPGLGKYTAGAVAAFAMNLPAAIVDANIARVLARLFNFREEIDTASGQRQIWSWAEVLAPAKSPRAYHSGLMEVGQKICTPKRPACERCPVAAWCAGRGEGVEAIPRKKPKRATVFVAEHAILARRREKILLTCEQGRRRQGLWKLPERSLEELTAARAPVLLVLPYTITHHRVTLTVHEFARANARPGEEWHGISTLEALPMPSPYRRALRQLLGSES